MVAPRREALTIGGPAGALEASLERPVDSELRAVAVVCHPHPLHGGTMDNKVVYALVRAFATLGVAAMRFNFRGVGESAGAYDDGRGETADALAVAAALGERWPDARLFVAGFSFGAAVAVRVAQQLDPTGLVTVAPPIERLHADESMPRCPWLVIHGTDDALISLDSILAWLNALPPGPALEVIDGADHFFHGKLGGIRAALEAFVAPLLGTEDGLG